MNCRTNLGFTEQPKGIYVKLPNQDEKLINTQGNLNIANTSVTSGKSLKHLKHVGMLTCEETVLGPHKQINGMLMEIWNKHGNEDLTKTSLKQNDFGGTSILGNIHIISRRMVFIYHQVVDCLDMFWYHQIYCKSI